MRYQPVIHDDLEIMYNETRPEERIGMPDFNFDEIQVGQIEWPKRGRKPKALPETLVKALHYSIENAATPNLVMPSDDVTSFCNLLSRAGGQLNLRIEKHIQPDVPEKGKSTVHFRARGKRNKEI